MAGSMALHLKHGFSKSLFHPQLIYMGISFNYVQSRLPLFIEIITVLFPEQHLFYLFSTELNTHLSTIRCRSIETNTIGMVGYIGRVA